ncbi:MAG: sterol-binding protein [Jatrophihabitans sp.]|nr:MAG: sterol-binding protein [Jatrophihabitans sp.]
MASREQCEQALHRLAERLGGADDATRSRAGFDRTLSCRLRDLDTAFAGRLADGRLHDIREIDAAQAREAQVKLAMSSDDLLALVAGDLNMAAAWASGRIRVDAGILDLLRLRTIF